MRQLPLDRVRRHGWASGRASCGAASAESAVAVLDACGFLHPAGVFHQHMPRRDPNSAPKILEGSFS